MMLTDIYIDFYICIYLLVTVNITESCPDTYNSTIQELHYPPANAENNTQNNCSWKITVPKDRTVDLKFIDLQFDSGRQCDHSFLEVFDGFGLGSLGLGDKICRQSVIEEMESPGNEITLRYTSTSLNGSDRFTIGYGVSGNYIIAALVWERNIVHL